MFIVQFSFLSTFNSNSTEHFLVLDNTQDCTEMEARLCLDERISCSNLIFQFHTRTVYTLVSIAWSIRLRIQGEGLETES